MSTIRFRRASVLAVVAFSFAAGQARTPQPAADESPARPNVLFIAVLYDHEESDPLEVRNLAADPAHAETVKELGVLLDERWAESLR